MNGAHGGLKRNSTQGSFKRNESFDSMAKANKDEDHLVVRKRFL